MYNNEQLSYSKYLSKLKPEDKCYCGWYPKDKCPSCPSELSNADKIAENSFKK